MFGGVVVSPTLGSYMLRLVSVIRPFAEKKGMEIHMETEPVN